jgi:hypothetical protein
VFASLCEINSVRLREKLYGALGRKTAPAGTLAGAGRNVGWSGEGRSMLLKTVLTLHTLATIPK